ncbi:hypothetical protein [Bacillus sp. C28GYM-DRY-1]|uniref:hypothetical protein n=1 Tax=Bacillus sp. C28GYM-DRY-1 TaxID=3062686 RepID=UPI0026762F79|nr:hypothetical protein [Bacillus sp. C28GYM-DRY-1]MDO3659995.1 hypothetical protein [Bacillus sp. C28GYM-DRY-1]
MNVSALVKAGIVSIERKCGNRAAIRLRDFFSVSLVFLREEMRLEYVMLRYSDIWADIFSTQGISRSAE